MGMIEAIRDTLNQELVSGTGKFKRQIEVIPGRQTEAGNKGRPPAQVVYD